MSFFCNHDWVIFRQAERSLNRSNKWVHHYDGTLVSKREHAHLITDDVCSKCHKLKLDLKKAIEWGEKNKQKIARRDKAKNWAQKYIGLTDKT